MRLRIDRSREPRGVPNRDHLICPWGGEQLSDAAGIQRCVCIDADRPRVSRSMNGT